MQRGLRKQTIRTLTLLLVVGCSEPAPPHSGAERFAPVAHDLFTAAARRDNERLRLLAADSMTYNRILALAETHPDLIADASHGVVPQKAPLRVEADTAYIVYMPHGRYLQRNLLAVRFVRAGSTWLVDYVGFQEPLDGF
jgi:hypothetical protein